MRVLHVIPSISSKRGGPSKAVIDMVKALRQEGIDASILTTTDNIYYQECVYPEGKWFEHEEVPVLMYSCIGLYFRQLREFLFSPGLTIWLLRNINKYDLVHVHALFSYPSTVAMLIARYKHIPYIVRSIGQLNAWSLTQSYWMKRVMLAVVERANIDGSVAIHVTSNSEEEDVRKLVFKSEVLNLGLGIATSERRAKPSRIPENKITVFLFLSRLHPKKQLENLLEAFFIFQKKYHRNDWLLYVAGDGESGYVQKLHRLANELDLERNIIWMGHISGVRKEVILSSSDWFILPSASENFGISAVEALASGVPVILTKEVGIADLVSGYRAGIISPGSPDGLSDILNKAIDGPTVQMKKATLHLVDEVFTWNKVIKPLISFYSKTISTL
jgi:glycosyltransferase involved in cell wall biosynthesis